MIELKLLMERLNIFFTEEEEEEGSASRIFE